MKKLLYPTLLLAIISGACSPVKAQQTSDKKHLAIPFSQVGMPTLKEPSSINSIGSTQPIRRLMTNRCLWMPFRRKTW